MTITTILMSVLLPFRLLAFFGRFHLTEVNDSFEYGNRVDVQKLQAVQMSLLNLTDIANIQAQTQKLGAAHD